jgi:hypothetical protein
MPDEPDALSFMTNPQAAATRPQPAPRFNSDALSFMAEPIGGYVKEKARDGGTYADVQRTLTGFDLGPQGEQYFNLEAARGTHEKEGEGLDYLARRLPGGGAIGQAARDIRFNRVVESYQKGTATKDDLDFLARYERIKEIDAQRESTTAGFVANKLSYLPALAGEAYLTKGVPLGPLGRGVIGANVVAPAVKAQLIPSFTLKAAGERVAEQGGSITDVKNLAPAAAMSALNNIVLHGVGEVGKGLSLPGRVAAGTGTGMAGQQLVDALGGAADEALNDGYKTKTRYGLVGQLARGETDDALKNAAAQVVMFAAFSVLGGKPKDPLAGTEFYRPTEPVESLVPGGPEQPPPGATRRRGRTRSTGRSPTSSTTCRAGGTTGSGSGPRRRRWATGSPSSARPTR